MPDYKRHYTYLVGEIDKALTLMDTENPFLWKRVRAILQNALLEAEERVIKEMDTTKIHKIR